MNSTQQSNNLQKNKDKPRGTSNSNFNNTSNINNYTTNGSVARAVQFIFIDDDGQFQISKEALKIFEASQNKIAIICITGCYRTGKSFLMNQLVGDQGVFQVEASVNACTRGLWFYSEPITIEKDGEIFDIYVMDSEGLGGVDKNQNYDIKIFTLCVLLSSFLIYNQVGVIDETAITNLSLVTNLAKNIQIQKNQQSNTGGANGMNNQQTLSDYFPQFLWLLRDFILELADEDGNPITPNEYLELCLREAEGFSQKIAEKNRIRNLIRSFFKSRYCFTMIRPTDEERDIQNLNKNQQRIKEEFLDQIEELKIYIFNRIKPIKLNQVALKSQDYLILANSYIQSINKGSIPTINDAWTEVVENQLKQALNKACRLYQKEMKNYIQQYGTPQDLDALSIQHKQVQGQCQEILDKIITNQSNIKEMYDQIKSKVKAEYDRQAKDILAELYREKILPKQYTDLATFYKDWQDLEKTYFSRVPGKSKYELWSKFSVEKITDGSLRIQKSQESKKDLQLKQMELEVGRLQTIIEMKGESQQKQSGATEQLLQEIQKKLVQSQQRENELRMNIVAYQELVQRKDEEVTSLQEQMGRMRNTSIYNQFRETTGGGQFRGQQMVGNQQQHTIIGEGHEYMPPMCGTKDCNIF
eukprot:403369487